MKISNLAAHLREEFNLDALLDLSDKNLNDDQITERLSIVFKDVEISKALFKILDYKMPLNERLAKSKANQLGLDIDNQIRRNLIVLHEDDHCHISIGIKKGSKDNNNRKNNAFDFIEVLSRTESTISSAPNDQIILIIDGQLEYRQFNYQIAESCVSRSLLKDLSIKETSQGILKKGDTIKMGASSIVKLTCEKYCLYAIYRRKKTAPYQVIFDETLRARQLADTSKTITRMKFNLQLLAHLSKDCDIVRESIKSAFNHHAHTVRWEAIKTANKIAPDLARDLIVLGLTDEHDELRQICQKIVQQNEVA